MSLKTEYEVWRDELHPEAKPGLLERLSPPAALLALLILIGVAAYLRPFLDVPRQVRAHPPHAVAQGVE